MSRQLKPMAMLPQNITHTITRQKMINQCDGTHILLRSRVDSEISSSMVMIRSMYPWDLTRLKMHLLCDYAK